MTKKDFRNLNLNESTQNLLIVTEYLTPTDCQARTIPLLCRKKDVIVQSPTGTGKTLAYVLPCINEIKTDICALIIVPTRELAEQIKNVVNKICNDEVCVACYGGRAIKDDYKKMENKKIVVATPGRISEILKTKKKYFEKIEFLIVDEADKMFGLGFEGHLRTIFLLLQNKKTVGLFSATISNSVLDFSRSFVRNPVRIECEGVVPEQIKINFVNLNGIDKLKFLVSVINEETIVFFSTCASVDYFHALFNQMGYEVDKIHGKMKQADRSNVYENRKNCLFCTDVAARGIDFSCIKNVIHFDVPNDPQNFIHRSGRTARNGESGEVTLILMDNEINYTKYLEIKGIFIVEKKTSITNIDLQVHKLDEATLKYSVNAFVCYLRSYKEHIVNYLLSFKNLNFDSLAELHFLEKIPRMDELMNVKFKNYEKIKNLQRNKFKLKRGGDKNKTVVRSSKLRKKK